MIVVVILLGLAQAVTIGWLIFDRRKRPLTYLVKAKATSISVTQTMNGTFGTIEFQDHGSFIKERKL